MPLPFPVPVSLPSPFPESRGVTIFVNALRMVMLFDLETKTDA